MKENKYAKCSPETLKRIKEIREEKRANSFMGKLKASREEHKDEMNSCREAEVVMTEEILESTKALRTVSPSSPAYSAAADNIEKLGKTVEKLNTKRTADKKLLIPIVGSIAATGMVYGFEKLGKTALTGGFKDIGRKLISVPMSFIGRNK